MRQVFRSSRSTWAVVAGAVLAAQPAIAQLSLQQALLLRDGGTALVTPPAEAAIAAPATTEDALHALADQAAVIFTGQVLRVQQAGGTVRIDLQVEDGIRGVATGETYTLQEWAGAWSAHADRLRVGQRALYLLHAPSVGGFSSPVGGADGIVPLSGDANTLATDLRWIAARVLRNVATRTDNAPDGVAVKANTLYASSGKAVVATAAHRASAAANGIAWPADATNGNVLGVDLHAIDANLVSGLLRAWKPVAGVR